VVGRPNTPRHVRSAAAWFSWPGAADTRTDHTDAFFIDRLLLASAEDYSGRAGPSLRRSIERNPATAKLGASASPPVFASARI